MAATPMQMPKSTTTPGLGLWVVGQGLQPRGVCPAAAGRLLVAFCFGVSLSSKVNCFIRTVRASLQASMSPNCLHTGCWPHRGHAPCMDLSFVWRGGSTCGHDCPLHTGPWPHRAQDQLTRGSCLQVWRASTLLACQPQTAHKALLHWRLRGLGDGHSGTSVEGATKCFIFTWGWSLSSESECKHRWTSSAQRPVSLAPTRVLACPCQCHAHRRMSLPLAHRWTSMRRCPCRQRT